MIRNAEAITIFCSYLSVADDVKPLTPKEWSILVSKLMQQKLVPGDLLDFELGDFINRLNCSTEEAQRFMRLIDRSGSLRFELSKYEDMGIQVVTRADKDYPKQLKRKLGNNCPPLFYYAGDLELLNKPAVGYVGSRKIEPDDIVFTKKTVTKTAKKGFAVVSGGAEGIDSVSATVATSEAVPVIEYISDSMLRKMRNSGLVSLIREKRVLLMSVVVPTAGFNTGTAMARNRFIYSQSNGTVVIRTDNGKGGTWAGATENLRKQWCPTFCRKCNYPGNQELIQLGAIPIDDNWDGNVLSIPEDTVANNMHEKPAEQCEQISLFNIMSTS